MVKKLMESLDEVDALLSLYIRQGGNEGFKDQEQLQKSFLNETHDFFVETLSTLSRSKMDNYVVEKLNVIGDKARGALSLTDSYKAETEYLRSRLLSIFYSTHNLVKDHTSKYGKVEELKLIIKEMPSHRWGLFSGDVLIQTFPTRENAEEYKKAMGRKSAKAETLSKLDELIPSRRKDFLRDNLFEVSTALNENEESPDEIERTRRLSLRPMIGHLYDEDEDYEPTEEISMKKIADEIWKEALERAEEKLTQPQGNLDNILFSFKKKKREQKLSEDNRDRLLDDAVNLMIKDEKNRSG